MLQAIPCNHNVVSMALIFTVVSDAGAFNGGAGLEAIVVQLLLREVKSWLNYHEDLLDANNQRAEMFRFLR